MRTFFCLICCIIGTVVFEPASVRAAELYFGTDVPRAGVGQLFEVGLLAHTESETVNAFEGALVYPADAVEVVRIQTGGSLISAWVQTPKLSALCAQACRIPFSGIVPGGFRGESGYLFSLILRAKRVGDFTLSIEDERLLLHDGRGTSVTTTRSPIRIMVSESDPTLATSPPKDDLPPEDFTVDRVRDPSLFDGRPALVFSTQDKQSGVDHYEIKTNWGFGKGRGTWRMTESPHRLRRFESYATIVIKAVDGFGNETVSVTGIPFAARAVAALFVVLCFSWIVVRLRKP